MEGSFTDAGIDDTHTATWHWGDETTQGTVTEEGGSGSVEGIHTYAVAGEYTITLSVTDDDEGEGKATTQIVVVSPQGGVASRTSLKTSTSLLMISQVFNTPLINSLVISMAG